MYTEEEECGWERSWSTATAAAPHSPTIFEQSSSMSSPFSTSSFLSPSLPPCPSSITSFSHALLPPDFSFGAAAGPHIMATFICGSLLHAFIFSFTSFFILSQKRAHIHLADKRFTSDPSQLISVSFPPSAMLTTSEPFGVISSKMFH